MNIRIWICCERSPTARDFVYVRNLNVELKSLDGGGSARECGALSWGAGACAAWRWAECVSHVLRRLHARRSRQGARPVSLHKTKDKDRKCTGEKREASHERDAECAGRSTHRPQHAQAAARTSCSVYELEHPHVTAPKLQHTSCSTQVAAHESQHTSCSTQAAAHNTPRHPSLPATRQPSPPPPPPPQHPRLHLGQPSVSAA